MIRKLKQTNKQQQVEKGNSAFSSKCEQKEQSNYILGTTTWYVKGHKLEKPICYYRKFIFLYSKGPFTPLCAIDLLHSFPCRSINWEITLVHIYILTRAVKP